MSRNDAEGEGRGAVSSPPHEDRHSRHKDSRDLDRGGRSGYREQRGRRNDHDRSDRYHNRDRNSRDDRDRENFDDYDRQGGHNSSRHREFDHDRDRRERHRSPSRSKESSRNNSSKRTSGFDMAPPGAAPSGATDVSGQFVGFPPAAQGMLQNMFPFGGAQLGALPMMPAQAMSQQATRHARRVYVGGLPPLANEQTIATFFSHVMSAIGGNSAGVGDAVVNVYINHEKKFAFVEMRTVEEASNAMTLDGIIFEGVAVRVRRPTDYNPSLAATLGPSQPSPHLNLAAAGLMPGTIGGAEGPDRIFVGGLPYYFTETQIRELLESFGPLRGFDLVKDRDTGNSKGYGFCVYQDGTVTDVACAALNGLKMGDKTLTVRRATLSNGQAKSEQEQILAQAQQHIAMQKMVFQASGLNLPGVGVPPSAATEIPTKVLCLSEAVTADELMDAEEYEEILEDMREECKKFGALVNIIIPRPTLDAEHTHGVGKVYLEYADTASCANAKNALNGRKFGGNTVSAVYFAEDKFHSGDYST